MPSLPKSSKKVEHREVIQVPQAELTGFDKRLGQHTAVKGHPLAAAIESYSVQFDRQLYEISVGIINIKEGPFVRATFSQLSPKGTNGRLVPIQLYGEKSYGAPLAREYSFEHNNETYTLVIEPRRFYRAVFQVVLLADEPIEDMDLESIDYNMTEGAMSGVLTREEMEEVSAKEMAKMLIDQGSDPDFLGLTKNGKDVGHR